MSRHPMPGLVWALLNYRGRLTGPSPVVSVPMTILTDFDTHYILFDNDGNAKVGTKTFRQAMAVRKRTGLNVTRVLDRSDS